MITKSLLRDEQPGAYYITIVTYQRALLFGEIVNEDECWRAIPEHFPNIELGAYVVMPNHVHGIIVINENGTTINSSSSVGAMHALPLPFRGVKPRSIGAIVGSFKSAVTKRSGREFNTTGIWQRNYGACPEPVEGNTSSATNRIYRTKPITSRRIPYCGTRIMKIR